MRDEFSASVKDRLMKRVGARCSNPECRQPTHGPGAVGDIAVSIGVAAHITSAAPGGPRFDSSLSPQERRAFGNAVWLCQNCAKLADSDVDRFTVDTLLRWKSGAEADALLAINGLASAPSEGVSPLTDVSSMSNQDTPALAYMEFRRLENLHAPRFPLDPQFDVAFLEIDSAGARIGWEVIEFMSGRPEHISETLSAFAAKTGERCREHRLDHHWLSVVVCGSSTATNEANAQALVRSIEGTANPFGVQVLIGFMAGLRYVDLVFTRA
jgi:hypothetical protein